MICDYFITDHLKKDTNCTINYILQTNKTIFQDEKTEAWEFPLPISGQLMQNVMLLNDDEQTIEK